MKKRNNDRIAKRREKKVNAMRFMAAIYRKRTKLELKSIAFIGHRIGQEDLTCNLSMPFSEAIEATSNCYMTYTYYPKYNDGAMNRLIYKCSEYENMAIIIQGPLVCKNHFTLESVRHYERMFPGIKVIVSTWKDAPTWELELIENEKDAIVVQSEYPSNPGFGNINLQSISSLAGVKKAKEIGIKYVLKTRSDTRVTADGIMEYLRSYVEGIPLEIKTNKQKSRIILFNCLLFHPYHDSGIFFFGFIDDMETFFDKELNPLQPIKHEANMIIAERWTYRKSFEHMGGENEIQIKYFDKILENGVHCDLKEWWETLGDRIVPLPISCLRPIWYKYDYNHEESNLTFSYRRKIFGGRNIDLTVVDWAMWSDLRNHRFTLDPSEYEYILDEFFE